MSVDVRPLTAERWPDFVDLFERPGPRGSWPRTAACYCAFWRRPSKDYEAAFRQRSLENVTGGPNKSFMKKLVAGGTVPGLLAYGDGEAIGWVAVAPRADMIRLEHSRDLRTDDEPAQDGAWSVACFSVHRSHWRAGVATALLDAAVERARAHGAPEVEGYPVQAGSIDPYTGYDTMFAAAGFRLVRPGRGKGRAVWRRSL